MCASSMCHGISGICYDKGCLDPLTDTSDNPGYSVCQSMCKSTRIFCNNFFKLATHGLIIFFSHLKYECQFKNNLNENVWVALNTARNFISHFNVGSNGSFQHIIVIYLCNLFTLHITGRVISNRTFFSFVA